MDGYLGQLEARLDRIEAKLAIYDLALAEPLTTYAKAESERKDKEFKDRKAAMEKEAADYAAKVKADDEARKSALEAARSQAEADLKKENDEKIKVEALNQVRAEHVAAMAQGKLEHEAWVASQPPAPPPPA